VPALVQHHWISSSQVGYLGAANLAGYLVGSLCGVRGNVTSRQIGPSMLAITVSCIACAFPFGFPWLSSWRFVAGVAGGVVMTTIVPVIQSRTDEAKRSATVAVAFAGVGAGIVFSGAATPHLVSHGLGFASAGLAVLSLVLTAISWPTWQSKGPPVLQDAMKSRTGGAMADRRRIILLGLSYAAAIAFVPYAVFWVDYIARGLRAGMREAALCWILFGISAALGPTLCVQVANRMGASRALRWALLGNCVAVALPLASSHLPALAASSIGGGSMAMGITALTATRVRELAPQELHQRLWAGMTIIFAIAFATAGWVYSYVFAATQSYRFLFLWSGVALLDGGLAQCFEPRRIRSSSQSEVSSEAA
jgi:predicted MFS family arabinose efflux permease